jgi:phage pi2 protein 07
MSVTEESMREFWKGMNGLALKNDHVVITKEEYEELKLANTKLNVLMNAGVDNWEWYGDAMSSLNDSLDEDDDE